MPAPASRSASAPAFGSAGSAPATRADRAREAIAAALLALVREGDLRPTAPRVAARAGVSLRLVFHHFREMEAVWQLAAERQLERLRALLRPVPLEAPFEARLAAFVGQRARVYEEIAPVRRAALLQAPLSPAIAASLDRARATKRAQAAEVFAPELARLPAVARADVLAAVAAAASWSMWDALRAQQGLSVVRARRVVTRTLRALLSGGGR